MHLGRRTAIRRAGSSEGEHRLPHLQEFGEGAAACNRQATCYDVADVARTSSRIDP
jgi:hypothetical protein